jgi:hypothetical protein
VRVRFFRRKFVTAMVPVQGAVRAFELSLGLEAPVNAESGMTVNLVKVDEWLSQIPADLVFASEILALEDYRKRLIALVGSAARVVSVEIKYDRKWWTHAERGVEIGVREAARAVVDGRSVPVWRETVSGADGVVREIRDVEYDGQTTRTRLV